MQAIEQSNHCMITQKYNTYTVENSYVQYLCWQMKKAQQIIGTIDTFN